MNDVILFGIKNCDTMKKAMKWLEGHGHNFLFHDYKKEGVDPQILKDAIKEHGWETVLNRRGTTWRQLSDQIKNTMDDKKALHAGLDNPSLIKRPLLLYKGKTYFGFKPEEYSQIFGK